ncbi:Plasminogen (Fragment) [Seminavis robusta]|uniref:Plasminogen n=1 Tax=Seminavis robusta TaxID=568900 RepID=A0A9N8DYG1_9STRA
MKNPKTLLSTLILAATLAGTTTVSAQSSERLDGGRDADPEQYPFYVSLELGCAGTLVAPDVVLTSSHCLADGAGINMNVTVKTENFPEFNESRSIVGISRHPKYLENSLGYDLAVLLLNAPVDGAIPVEINMNASLPMAGDNLTVIGFPSYTITTIGVNNTVTEIQYEVLQEGTIAALPDSACADAYGDVWQGNSTMLCAGNEEGGSVFNCADDRGSPLLDDENRMVGIVSLGSTCGKKDLPGIYMRASAFNDWIEYQICTLSADPPAFCEALLEYYFPYTVNSNNSILVTLPPPNNTNTPAPTDAPTEPAPKETVALRLEIHYDAYGIENSWMLRNSDEDEIIDEKKYYTVAPAGLSSTLYENLLPGNYSFIIQDYANDGICCDFGEGFVRLSQVYNGNVKTDDREIWYVQGNFEAQASVEFPLVPYDVGSNATTGTAVNKNESPNN